VTEENNGKPNLVIVLNKAVVKATPEWQDLKEGLIEKDNFKALFNMETLHNSNALLYLCGDLGEQIPAHWQQLALGAKKLMVEIVRNKSVFVQGTS
jgi:hypothetical protein